MVSAGIRLHEATAALERPLPSPQGPVPPWTEVDVFTVADRAAWEDRLLHTLPPGAPQLPDAADRGQSVELITQLARLRRPTKSPSQLVHGDLYGTVLFTGTAAPGITDITLYWRPASWAAGVAVVDALSWGEADDGLIERWDILPEWPQMLLRALMFRLGVHAMHPRSTPEAFGRRAPPAGANDGLEPSTANRSAGIRRGPVRLGFGRPSRAGLRRPTVSATDWRRKFFPAFAVVQAFACRRDDRRRRGCSPFFGTCGAVVTPD